MPQLLGTFQDNTRVFIVLRFELHGSLRHFLNRTTILPIDVSQNFVIDIVMGLQHLHKRNLIHADLKLDNVLLDENLRAHFTDFGLRANQENVWYGEFGTKKCRSPDQIEGTIAWDRRVDYFVVGIIFMQMITGRSRRRK